MKRQGFTLVEMLVVIGIVAVIIGIAVPVLVVARQKSTNARIQADMASIAIALSAYKADFGDFPRVEEARKFPAAINIPNDLFNPAYISGAELLCWSLVGPYGQTGGGGFTPGDGADGSGFRLNPSGRGQVYASYLNAERFRWGKDATFSRYPALLDYADKQILYFTSRPGQRTMSTITVGGVDYQAQDVCDPAKGYVSRGSASIWDLRDNEAAFAASPFDAPQRLQKFAQVMGNRDGTGVIAYQIQAGQVLMNEQPITAPFVLLAAGTDNLYGTSDDILVTP
jgi:prepilin-type N-terminal cleavage/methylation domain-containing protein